MLCFGFQVPKLQMHPDSVSLLGEGLHILWCCLYMGCRWEAYTPSILLLAVHLQVPCGKLLSVL